MNTVDDSASVRDYGFLLFLTLLNIMNFVDRQLLASFGNWIKPELGLSNTEFGILTGLAFLLFYSVGGLFMGALADKYNRTRLIAFGLAFWSLLTALSGAARGFVSMLIPRMMIGVGESMMTPTAMSLLSDRFPARQLGFASGFYYMGVPVGVAASLFVVAYLEPVLGWRGCFYLLGGIGLFLALIILLFLREPKRRQLGPLEQGEGRVSFSEIAATLIGALKNSPALMMTIGGGVAYHFILGAATFEQLWFVEERGFDRSEIAKITGWIGIFGGILGNLFGGIGGDKFLAKTGMGRPMFLFWIMLIFAPLNIYLRLVDPSSLWFYAGIFVGFFQLGCFYGPTFSTVQELVPPNIRGTVVGFYIVALNLVGVVIGVTAGGWVIDQLQAAGNPNAYTHTLLGFTLISLLAIPLFFFAGRRYEQDKAALYSGLEKNRNQ